MFVVVATAANAAAIIAPFNSLIVPIHYHTFPLQTNFNLIRVLKL